MNSLRIVLAATLLLSPALVPAQIATTTSLVGAVTDASGKTVLGAMVTAVSELLSTRDVSDLPLNGRNPLRLAVTTPGVVFGLKPSNGTPPGEGFIGAGTREIQNAVSLDGISIVENLITKTPTRPMVEA